MIGNPIQKDNLINPALLLNEIEELLRTLPNSIQLDNNYEWQGRVRAVMEAYEPFKSINFISSLEKAAGQSFGGGAIARDNAYNQMVSMIYAARHTLRMQLIESTSRSFVTGDVFDYFNEVRKVIEITRKDIFFVDPYLDADFISTYLPYVHNGVSVRLLGKNYITKLLPAVEKMRQQSGLSIELRAGIDFHDRFLFIDNKECYLSGSSFKDGAKNAPAIFTQITDSYTTISGIYEKMWVGAQPQT